MLSRARNFTNAYSLATRLSNSLENSQIYKHKVGINYFIFYYFIFKLEVQHLIWKTKAILDYGNSVTFKIEF